MTKALHDFVKRAWLAIVSTQHAQYRFMVSHKSIFFVSDVSVFYDFLCFFLFVCFFQVLDEMIDLFIVLYHVMKHGNLMCGWCVWTVALNVLGLFFFLFYFFQSCQAVRRARTREHWCELLIGIHAVKTGFFLNLSTRERNDRNVYTEFLVTCWPLWFCVARI